VKHEPELIIGPNMLELARNLALWGLLQEARAEGCVDPDMTWQRWRDGAYRDYAKR
jgi:hypothetical protein